MTSFLANFIVEIGQKWRHMAGLWLNKAWCGSTLNVEFVLQLLVIRICWHKMKLWPKIHKNQVISNLEAVLESLLQMLFKNIVKMLNSYAFTHNSDSLMQNETMHGLTFTKVKIFSIWKLFWEAGFRCSSKSMWKCWIHSALLSNLDSLTQNETMVLNP